MNPDKLENARALAEKTGFLCIATVDAKGLSHIAAAGKMDLTNEGFVEVTEWFCPATVINLHSNKAVTMVVWDKDLDSGYQLLGRMEKIEDIGILDGFAPELEKPPPLPQIKRRLLIRVEKIMDFKLGPHSDVET